MTTPIVFDVQGTEPLTLASFDGDPVVKGLEAYLYVVEFGDYGIKVGVTSNPVQRVATHLKNGRDFGRPATRGLLTGPHQEAAANERKLIDFCRRISGLPATYRGEYFPINLPVVRDFLVDLPQTRGDRAQFEAAIQARGASVINAIFASMPTEPERFAPVFPWAAHLDPGDLAAFLNELRDALELPDPLAAIDHVVVEWRIYVAAELQTELQGGAR